MTTKQKIALLGIIIMASTMQALAVLEPTKIYIYGFSAAFNDSTIYMTDIMEVDSAWVDSKTHFLYSRDNYSLQLQHYLKEKGIEYPTCLIGFDVDRKKAEKKFIKLRKRYTGENASYLIKYLTSNEFTFEAISAADDPDAIASSTNEARKAQKKADKERKKAMKQKDRSKRPPRPGAPGQMPPPGGHR